VYVVNTVVKKSIAYIESVILLASYRLPELPLLGAYKYSAAPLRDQASSIRVFGQPESPASRRRQAHGSLKDPHPRKVQW